MLTRKDTWKGFARRASFLKRSLFQTKKRDDKKKLWRGPRTKQWDRIRRQLKVEFLKRGIITCELRLPGCRVDDTLGFAHRFKRRFIAFADEDELATVALLCNHCHDVIEGHERMKEIIDSVIERRAA